jgi:hypothetical protein
MNHDSDELVVEIATHQPAAPSATATCSMAASWSSGATSGPP